jgi:hypothetical protein
MLIAYEALISVYRSARRVETEIGHPIVWELIRGIVLDRFPRVPSQWLCDEPMRRHHYRYGRDRHLRPIKNELRDTFETIATRQAVIELGLCDPDGPGSVTHPELDRMLYADGKVLTPLWKAKPGDTRIEQGTGQLRQLRSDPDAALHVTGNGEPAWGTKHVMVATRSDEPHSRMILSVASVPDVGGEANIALDTIGRLAPQLPGALGVIYDGAFRGVHLTQLLHHHGLVPVVPVTAAAGGRHTRKPRVERTVLVGSGTIRHDDGTSSDCILYSEAGALCLGELTASGDVTLIPLERTKIEPRRNVDHTWRWYGVYTVPDHAGGGTLRVPLDTTDDDRRATSTAPSTSAPSHHQTPNTNASTPAAPTPKPSTVPSTTATGWPALTPPAAIANSSTSSATPSRSTRSRCTGTGAPTHHHNNSPPNQRAHRALAGGGSSRPTLLIRRNARPTALPLTNQANRRRFALGPRPSSLVAQGIERRFPKPPWHVR